MIFLDLKAINKSSISDFSLRAIFKKKKQYPTYKAPVRNICNKKPIKGNELIAIDTIKNKIIAPTATPKSCFKLFQALDLMFVFVNII